MKGFMNEYLFHFNFSILEFISLTHKFTQHTFKECLLFQKQEHTLSQKQEQTKGRQYGHSPPNNICSSGRKVSDCTEHTMKEVSMIYQQHAEDRHFTPNLAYLGVQVYRRFQKAVTLGRKALRLGREQLWGQQIAPCVRRQGTQGNNTESLAGRSWRGQARKVQEGLVGSMRLSIKSPWYKHDCPVRDTNRIIVKFLF